MDGPDELVGADFIIQPRANDQPHLLCREPRQTARGALSRVEAESVLERSRMS